MPNEMIPLDTPEIRELLEYVQEITLDEVTCVGPRGSLKTFSDFINTIHQYEEYSNWPELDLWRCINLHLKEKKLIRRHVELYINYPEWTERELARAYQIPAYKVHRMLIQVRRAWPGLRFETGEHHRHCSPEIDHMSRIELSAYSDDRLNGDIVTKF